MESHGEHKRDKAAMAFWVFIGVGLGIVIGSSTSAPGPHQDSNGWVLGMIAGLIMGGVMAFLATKPGLDQ